MPAPFFSIVTATYNAAMVLPSLLDSLAGQSCRDFELVLQDGASDDASVAVAESYRGRLPALSLVSEPDSGIYDAWNKALPRVHGKWVLFLGADDRLANNDTLAKAAKLLEGLSPEVRFACGAAVVVASGTGVVIEKRFPESAPVKAYQRLSHGELPACHTSVFHRRQIVSQYRFDASYTIAGDYDFLCRVMTAPEQYQALDMEVVAMGDGGISTLPQTALRMRWEYLRAMRHAFPWNIEFTSNILPVIKGCLLHSVCVALGEKRAPRVLDGIRTMRGLPARWAKEPRQNAGSGAYMVMTPTADSDPLVSIILPAYNVEPWIGETLRSVLGQTLTNWECIVINDGSEDATGNIIRSFADRRMQLLEVPNGGVSVARNLGLIKARGRFIAFLDADDIWPARALEWLVAPLRQTPEYVLSWGDFIRFEDKTNRELSVPGTRLYHTGDVWLDMLVDNFMQFGALCVRAEVAKQVMFDASLRIGEDRDWLLRLLKGRRAIHVPRVVHYYRQRQGSAVRDIRRFLDDEEKMMRPHVQSADVPERIRRRALSSLAFHQGVLLAKLPGERLGALRRLLSAVLEEPLYCEYYLRMLRKLWFTLCPARYVVLPEYHTAGAGTGK